MLIYNDKEFRNLEEQVLKNTDDIQIIKDEANIAELGIKVVSGVPLQSASELPADYTGDYGDAYLVGTETPYDLYIWTRTANPDKEGDWFNFGPLNAPSIVPGPQGPVGPQGEQGTRGSTWQSANTVPSVVQGLNTGDQALNTATGDVYQYGTSGWVLTGNIRGPQGLQGVQGLEGKQGKQGIQGPPGPEGPQGQMIEIVGELSATSQLPDPTSIPRYYAYLIPIGGAKHIYLIVGTDTLTWTDAGAFGGGSDVIISGVDQPSVNMTTVPNVAYNYGIAETTTVSTNGSSITFTDLQAVSNNVNGTQIDQVGDISLPITNNGDVMFASENNNSVLSMFISNDGWTQIRNRIKSDATAYIINITGSATSGTFSPGQLAEIKAKPENVIININSVNPASRQLSLTLTSIKGGATPISYIYGCVDHDITYGGTGNNWISWISVNALTGAWTFNNRKILQPSDNRLVRHDVMISRNTAGSSLFSVTFTIYESENINITNYDTLLSVLETKTAVNDPRHKQASGSLWEDGDEIYYIINGIAKSSDGRLCLYGNSLNYGTSTSPEFDIATTITINNNPAITIYDNKNTILTFL